jgi:hypothetical protein
LDIDGLSASQSITALALDVDGSLLAADVRGTFYRIAPGESTAQALQDTPPEIFRYTTIMPYDGGFIAGGSKGTLQRYAKDGEICSLTSSSIPGSVNQIAPFGDGFLLAVDVDVELPGRIVYFTKKK